MRFRSDVVWLVVMLAVIALIGASQRHAPSPPPLTPLASNAPASSSPPRETSGVTVISGQVLDMSSAQPVGGASVQVCNARGTSKVARATTAGDGTFSVRVEACQGDCSVFVSADDYVRLERKLSDEEKSSGVIHLVLERSGTIYGQIAKADNLVLTALPVAPNSGRAKSKLVRAPGHYRMPWIKPGEYVLAAFNTPNEPWYYPGTRDPSKATVLHVRFKQPVEASYSLP